LESLDAIDVVEGTQSSISYVHMGLSISFICLEVRSGRRRLKWSFSVRVLLVLCLPGHLVIYKDSEVAYTMGLDYFLLNLILKDKMLFIYTKIYCDFNDINYYFFLSSIIYIRAYFHCFTWNI